MATHDYVIDNSTGANVRTDLNLVFQAILTNNSSSSAPSPTAAYMWWADTSNGILKIRNSANNGWVELLQLDGTLTLEDGTATAPALANRSNLNTGIFFSAANTFNIATAGVERMELASTGTVFNKDGEDVDFRIEGDTLANLFYVNAGTDRVGINTDTPLGHLGVAAAAGTSGTTASAGYDEFVIEGGNEDIGMCFLSPAANNRTQTIAFGDSNNNSSGKIQYNHSTDDLTITAADNIILTGDAVGIGTSSPLKKLHISDAGDVGIALQTTNANTNKEIWEITCSANASSEADLIFQSRTDAGSGGIEAMRLASSGKVGIGTTSPTRKLHVLENAGDDIATFVNADTTNGYGVNIKGGGSASGRYVLRLADGANNDVMRVLANGNVGIGTSSPSKKLDVSGDLHVSAQILNERGTASAPPFSFTDDTDTGMFNDANAALGFSVSGTEGMRIDSFGRLFLGLTTLQYPKKLNVQGESGSVIHLNNYDTTTYAANTSTAIEFNLNTGNTGNQTGACELRAFKENGTNGNNARGFSFYTGVNGGGNTERMRIDSSGNVLIGMTSTSFSGQTGFQFIDSSTNANMSNVMDTSTASHSTYHLYNTNSTNSGYRFYVYANGGIANYSGNNYNLSDERMKKNITNMSSVYENFKKFVFRDFNYISDESSEIKKHGVIAQEVETIDADLITESFKVDSDSEGNAIYRKGLREQQFMMIGLKALQEAIAKIETLETKVAALEAA